MQLSNSSCAVALPSEHNNATLINNINVDATVNATKSHKPLSMKELRMKLRAQLVRNYSDHCADGKAYEPEAPDEIVPMVKAADLIYTLQLGGFEFSLIDDRLSIEPYEKLTFATKELINQNDSEIIAELRRI